MEAMSGARTQHNHWVSRKIKKKQNIKVKCRLHLNILCSYMLAIKSILPYSLSPANSA